jgi:selenide, water dikinase
LAQVLRHVPAVSDPRVLVDAATRDDAAVFQVAADRALVATVDFFTPIVDDPYTFGRIAVANALSDLYAMGAKPLFGLNLVAWPRKPEVLALLGDTLRGGADTAREAGLLILGGHSIDDEEPKYGLVAIGEAHPDRLITNRGASPGDRLVLTKPLGTGILSTALKQDLIGEADMAAAVESMTTLNVAGMEAMLALGSAVHAGTDVTGFGLIGHLRNLLEGAELSARVDSAHVPMFAGAASLVAKRAIPGGTARNRETADSFTTWAPSLDAATRTLLCDAQTSGGLLIAVAQNAVDRLLKELSSRGVAGAVIGHVTAGAAGTVEVT